ncbi:MAG: hypothetical protein ABGX22_05625 [Pirellulaceae bacterium]
MNRTFFFRVALAMFTIFPCGCLPSFYRIEADRDAYSMIAEKSENPHWGLMDYTIDVDPRSRMHDPFNPDCPPAPTDDPYSHAYMHWVDCKDGYEHWHANGETSYADNPNWLDFLDLDENGVLTLNSSSSYELARLHSPTYQNQLETLYLSALDVTAQRFQFDTQFFGGYSTGYRSTGPLASGSSINQLDATTRGMQARRVFTTGASMVVNFANALVWEFSGPNTHTISSTLDFTFIQPLLRAAGRDVIMEGLTQSERTLLGNVRQLDRYRRGFFLDTVYGTGAQAGPNRGGAFFGSVGTGTAGGAGGFLGLLQNLQTIRNQETNVAGLSSSLAQFEAYYEAGRVTFIQVADTRQTLFSANTGLLRSRRAFNDSLDRYKARLGIPPQVPVLVDDPMLNQFQLIDPEFNLLQNELTALQYVTGPKLVELNARATNNEPFDPGYVDSIRQLQRALRQSEEMRKKALEDFAVRASNSIEQFEETIPERVSAAARILERKRKLEERPRVSSEVPLLTSVDDELFATDELAELPLRLRTLLEEISTRIEKNGEIAQQTLAKMDVLAESGGALTEEELKVRLREDVFGAVPNLLTGLAADVIEISLLQATARGESITLIPVEMSPEMALEIARISRRDWMNARASLVDAWRQIQIVANDLESQLDIVIAGDIGTVGKNGLDFRSGTGNVRARLEFDAPITRLLERNGYRQVLINYQQARRTFYQIEDSIAAQHRAIARQVDQSRIDFELQRRRVQIAVTQVQSSRFALEAPAGAGGQGALGVQTARNLINALSSLRDAQDNFLGVWVTYEVQRGILDLNMGTMQLDERGMWVDPGAIGLEYGYPNVDDLPIEFRIPPNPSWLFPDGGIDSMLSPAPAPAPVEGADADPATE